LAEQIRRADLAVDSLVGDDEGLGRSREEVDADRTTCDRESMPER
jgi:hypothetical protein